MYSIIEARNITIRTIIELDWMQFIVSFQSLLSRLLPKSDFSIDKFLIIFLSLENSIFFLSSKWYEPFINFLAQSLKLVLTSFVFDQCNCTLCHCQGWSLQRPAWCTCNHSPRSQGNSNFIAIRKHLGWIKKKESYAFHFMPNFWEAILGDKVGRAQKK